MSLLTLSWLRGSTFTSLCTFIGALTILYFSISDLIRGTLKLLRIFIIRNLASRYGEGSWVVITGASEGIGKGFYGGFAQKRFNIVLISENTGDLKKIDEEIHQVNSNIKTKTIVADFKDAANPGFFDSIMKQLEGLDISVLVNNFGIAGGGLFKEQTEAEIRDIVVINTLPMVLLTRKLIARMNNRKNRSAIINLSSIMGTRLFPYFTMYSATKKVFIYFFARALAGEYPKMDIVSLRPEFVSTAMKFNKALSFHTLSPVKYVMGLIRKLRFKSPTAGYWRHGLYNVYMLVMSMLPDWLFKVIPRRLGQRIWGYFINDRDGLLKTTE